MSERRTETGRMLAFTDAVVAIAMTLLVLPLAELPLHGQGKLGDLLYEIGHHVAAIAGFAISFFVIARLWWAHHRIFEAVEVLTIPIVFVNVLWLFTIAVFPVTTSITTQYDPSWLAVLLYIGTMTASSALQTVLARLAVTRAEDPRQAFERFVGSLSTTVIYAVALVLGTAIEAVNYFGLFLLFLSGFADRIALRLLRRYQPASEVAE